MDNPLFGYLLWLSLDVLFGTGAATLSDEASKQEAAYDPPQAVKNIVTRLVAALTKIGKFVNEKLLVDVTIPHSRQKRKLPKKVSRPLPYRKIP